jgi:hypothetical protein
MKMMEKMEKMQIKHKKGMFIGSLILYALPGLGFASAGIACCVKAKQKNYFNDYTAAIISLYKTPNNLLLATYCIMLIISVISIVMEVMAYREDVTIVGMSNPRKTINKIKNGIFGLYTFAVWIYIQVKFFRNPYRDMVIEMKFAWIYFISIVYIQIGFSIIICLVCCCIIAKEGSKD